MTSTEREEIDPVADDRPEPLDPESRARPGITGTAVILADGRTWLLADVIPDLHCEVWDSLYEDNRVRGAYGSVDIAVAACWLLMHNYRLGLAAAHDLIVGVDPAALVPAVERALFGLGGREGGFSDWALTSLWTNGIDPDRLPPHLLWPVLIRLERLGRTEPRHSAIRADREASENAKFKALVQSRGLNRSPESPPGP